VPSLIH